MLMEAEMLVGARGRERQTINHPPSTQQHHTHEDDDDDGDSSLHVSLPMHIEETAWRSKFNWLLDIPFHGSSRCPLNNRRNCSCMQDQRAQAKMNVRGPNCITNKVKQSQRRHANNTQIRKQAPLPNHHNIF